ncbi:cbb3-type cytochrome c oxidase subunit II [Hymenobacter sp. H14-R3]|uniref:cbb3-type cytochrome c oxidase subunit II n=1 Tax=Hymenobacter sp. H14-R3 TaxID=3046308 RepID=UPI0024BBDBAE|nr:cbb3-type cytochrome c oxidase subunit II [Hymenobacter sp. H14-R3]MDJ0367714.1 cbb3-type cytochrome c oxidase subunit II [Hymenobacter sp. H14-R3]
MKSWNLYKNHRLFTGTVFLGFVGLSALIALQPAARVQADNAPLPTAVALTTDQQAGLQVFIGEGCVACHTQQVRNIDMDQRWGGRPGLPADYAWRQRQDVWRATPSILGSERTGPDLTEVSVRQPSDLWHLLHLYQPRSVVKESIMPAFPWLFQDSVAGTPAGLALHIPGGYREPGAHTIVPTRRAQQLVAYLLSLKQAPLPTGAQPAAFLKLTPPKEAAPAVGAAAAGPPAPDGAALYATNCQPCHQANGEGLKGAFPPLKGSPVVNDKDATLMVNIILQGYNPRPEYGVMPPFAAKLSDAEIAAIISHERSSWGNAAAPVTADFVQKIRALLKAPSPIALAQNP